MLDYFESVFDPYFFHQFDRSQIAFNCFDLCETNFDKEAREASMIPVIFQTEPGLYFFRPMQFSLVPHSYSRPPRCHKTMFARRETVMEKRIWSYSLKAHRCLIPVSGFLISFHSGEFAGNMMQVSHQDQPVLYAAGLWDRWSNTKYELYSSAVITTPASDYGLTGSARRAPLFVPSPLRDYWLDQENIISEDFFERSLASYAEDPWLLSLERKLKSKPQPPKAIFKGADLNF